jgi:ketosteroid isomerase-like protein
VKLLPVTAAVLFAASPAPAVPKTDVNPVVEAERAFARAAQTDGVNAAFIRYAAPDGLVFQPGPTNARQALAAHPIPPVKLDWWPAYAGVAASGDLGFTTGPYVVGEGEKQGHGWYFTIWMRQADGSWRWVLDHGPPTRQAAAYGRDAPVTVLPAGRTSGNGHAFGSLRAAEAHLAAALAADARAALPRFLAADGRLMRVGPQPAVGAAAWAPVLAAGPDRMETAPLDGAVSGAGDLAYTYGTARWQENGAAVSGYYVRIWQRREGGWKLIIDNLIAVPPAPPTG